MKPNGGRKIRHQPLGCFRLPATPRTVVPSETNGETAVHAYSNFPGAGPVTARIITPGLGLLKVASLQSQNPKNCNNSGCYKEESTMWQRLKAQQQRQAFPRLCAKPVLIRPYTGTVPDKSQAPPTVCAPSRPRKRRTVVRLGTAQTERRQTLARLGEGRVSTPQTGPGRRPDSRYNRATLYARLENGRSSGPEYEVPIIDMRFADFALSPILPECWK